MSHDSYDRLDWKPDEVDFYEVLARVEAVVNERYPMPPKPDGKDLGLEDVGEHLNVTVSFEGGSCSEETVAGVRDAMSSIPGRVTDARFIRSSWKLALSISLIVEHGSGSNVFFRPYVSLQVKTEDLALTQGLRAVLLQEINTALAPKQNGPSPGHAVTSVAGGAPTAVQHQAAGKPWYRDVAVEVIGGLLVLVIAGVVAALFFK